MKRKKPKLGRPKNSAGKHGWSGAAFRFARRAQEMPIADAAHRLGVSTSTISRWENDELEPPAALAAEAAHMLGVSRAALGARSKLGKKSRKVRERARRA